MRERVHKQLRALADEFAVERLALAYFRLDQLAPVERLLRDPRGGHRRGPADERPEHAGHCSQDHRIHRIVLCYLPFGVASAYRSPAGTSRSMAIDSISSRPDANSRCSPVTRFSSRPASAPGFASLRILST